MIYIILTILLSIILYAMYIYVQVHVANLIAGNNDLSETAIKCLTVIATRTKQQKNNKTK